MKMFLTRIGFGSKVVVTGDKTQIDLPRGQKSGIKEAEQVLANLEGIDFIYFSEKDVVRHKLETRMIGQRMNIAEVTGLEIVDAYNPMTLFEKTVTKVGADESGATGNKDVEHRVDHAGLSLLNV